MIRRQDMKHAIEDEVLSICRHMTLRDGDIPRSLAKDIGLDCGCPPDRGVRRWFW